MAFQMILCSTKPTRLFCMPSRSLVLEILRKRRRQSIFLDSPAAMHCFLTFRRSARAFAISQRSGHQGYEEISMKASWIGVRVSSRMLNRKSQTASRSSSKDLRRYRIAGQLYSFSCRDTKSWLHATLLYGDVQIQTQFCAFLRDDRALQVSCVWSTKKIK